MFYFPLSDNMGMIVPRVAPKLSTLLTTDIHTSPLSDVSFTMAILLLDIICSNFVDAHSKSSSLFSMLTKSLGTQWKSAWDKCGNDVFAFVVLRVDQALSKKKGAENLYTLES